MKKLEATAADPRNALNRARDATFAIDQIIASHERGGDGDLNSLKGKLFKDGDHAVFAATPGTTDARSKLMSRIRPPAKNYATIQPILLETTTHFWKKWLLEDAASENWLKNDLTGRVADAGVVKYESKK